MLKIKMSPLSDVLSRLSDEINMQEDLSHEMCPHKPEFPFIRVPIKRGLLYLVCDFCFLILHKYLSLSLSLSLKFLLLVKGRNYNFIMLI